MSVSFKENEERAKTVPTRLPGCCCSLSQSLNLLRMIATKLAFEKCLLERRGEGYHWADYLHWKDSQKFQFTMYILESPILLHKENSQKSQFTMYDIVNWDLWEFVLESLNLLCKMTVEMKFEKCINTRWRRCIGFLAGLFPQKSNEL